MVIASWPVIGWSEAAARRLWQNPAPMEPFQRLLVPLDFSEMTSLVVATARRLLAPNGQAALLHVVETLPLVMEGTYGVYAHRRDLEEMRRRSLERLAQLVSEAHDQRLEPQVREGKPAQEILAAAEAWRPEVIVIGSQGRTGLDHLLVGSVAERVLRRAPCHVFMVRG
jgi:nucleotide-binding universal stress UspA family protein